MGLFKQKKSRYYWMSLRLDDGRRVKISTKATNRILAEKIYAKNVANIAENRWFEKLPGENKTLSELLEKYMNEHSIPNKSPRTVLMDQFVVRDLNRFFGDIRLGDITSSRISDFKADCRNRLLAPATIQYRMAVLKHAFNLAIRNWEWVRENPVLKVTSEKINNARDRWLTSEEEKKLLDASPQWLREILVFGLYTGLRKSEILALEWSKVDVFRKTFSITEQKNKGKDTLPLNNFALEVLKARYKVRSIKTDLVFFSQNRTRIIDRNLTRAFHNAIKKAGIECRFHDLRHTFATRLCQLGVDLYRVQKLLRHKSIVVIQRYAHHNSESLRGGVEALCHTLVIPESKEVETECVSA